MSAQSPVPERKSLKGWLIGLAVALVASLAAVALVLTGVIPGFGGNTDGKLRLEGAEEPGAAAFMVADLVKPSSLITPIKKGAAIPAVNLTPAPVSGGTPGLYGGTGTETCNAGQLVSFLSQNPDKAAAWVAALNADPNLRWGNGQALTVAEIPVYISNLIPTVLQVDTWVTNHGFANGVATPFQSMLQRGTSVFVDRFGVPRARCLCGNPLLPPKLIEQPPLEGDPWDGLGELPPQTIDPTPEPIDELEVVDENGNLVKVTSPFCQALGGGSCPAPGPENQTQPAPTTDPATPTDPATDPAADVWYKKDNPVAPTFDVCSVAYVVPELNPADVTFDLTNNSGKEIDLWAPNMTWDDNLNVTSCQAEYVGTQRGGTSAGWHSAPGFTWIATDSATGSVLKQGENTGSAWVVS